MDDGVAARVARPLVAWLAMQGRDSADALTRAGIAPDALLHPTARVPEAAWRALWAEAEAIDPAAGLLVASLAARILAGGWPPAEHFAAAFLASAPTVGEGLAQLGAVQRLTMPGVGYAVEPEPTGWRRVRLVAEGGRTLREFLLAWPLLALPGLAAPRASWSWAVELPHPPPADLSHHHRLLGPDVRFGASEAAFRLGPEEWRTPMRQPDPAICAAVLQLARATAAGVAARVRELLAAGPLPSAEEAARQLGMSPRTLRRSLLEEGASYRDLVDAARRQRAEAARAAGLDLGEAARILGYSDVRALRRALRRWEGRRR